PGFDASAEDRAIGACQSVAIDTGAADAVVHRGVADPEVVGRALKELFVVVEVFVKDIPGKRITICFATDVWQAPFLVFHRVTQEADADLPQVGRAPSPDRGLPR